MLYGNDKLRREFLEQAQEFAQQNKIRLIYCSMVGSLSKGLQVLDSDYDTRFLYIRDDFPQKIYLPKDCKEDELKLRYYPKDTKIYEWTPFWELTSFFQFLVEPSFDGKKSLGLYDLVNWTMNSPFAWDPYGLQNKLRPLIDLAFNPQYIVDYHSQLVIKYLGKDKKVPIRYYLDAIYSAMVIEWVLKYNTFYPIYFHTMLPYLDATVRTEIEKIFLTSHEMTTKYIEQKYGQYDPEVLRDDNEKSHYTNKIDRNLIIEKWIEKLMETVKKDLQIANFKQSNNISNVVNEIYKIVDFSVNKDIVIGGFK